MNRTQKTVLAILVFSSIIALSMVKSSRDNDEVTWAKFTSQHQPTATTMVETVISRVDDDAETNNGDAGGSATPNLPGITDTTNPTDWLAMCDSTHKSWGAAGLIYDQEDKTITINGTEYAIRTDCSGYVGFCMYRMGWTTSTKPISSGSDLTAFGFTEVSASERQPGDILAYSGHIEVLYQLNDGHNDIVYNWGGPASAENKYTGVDASTVQSYGNSGHSSSQLVAVWRPPSTSEPAPTTPDSPLEPAIPRGDKVVFIDAGHNWVSNGALPDMGNCQARCDFENQFTIAMRLALKSELESNGYTVCQIEDFTATDGNGNTVQTTLANCGNKGRAKIFQSSNASVMIQIHSNAVGDRVDKNYTTHGGQYLYCSENGKALSECIAKYYKDTSIGNNSNAFLPKTKSSYAVFNNTSKTCIILECGFGNTHDSQGGVAEPDNAKMSDPNVRKKLAAAVRKGLDDYFAGN